MANIYYGDLTLLVSKRKDCDKYFSLIPVLNADMQHANGSTITVRIYFHMLHFMGTINVHVVVSIFMV